MRIGELAAAAGVSVQTVRYYERRGLLKPPARLPTSGYRDYALESIDIVRSIKELQEVGFTLREAEQFIKLLNGPNHKPEDTRAIALAKIRNMDEQVKRMQAMRDKLEMRLRSCECCNAASTNTKGKSFRSGQRAESLRTATGRRKGVRERKRPSV